MSPHPSIRPPSAHLDDVLAESIPADLRREARWVAWSWVWSEEKNKWDKPPIDPDTGHPTNATDRRAWMPFERAVRVARKKGDGVGFAMGDGGDFVGVDLDGVLDHEGNVSDWARPIVDRLASYTEVTPSGRGLHVWLRGELPKDDEGHTRCRTKNRPGIEFYGSGRYFTVTGRKFDGAPSEVLERRHELFALHREIFAPPPPRVAAHDRSPLALDDAAIIQAAAAVELMPNRGSSTSLRGWSS